MTMQFKESYQHSWIATIDDDLNPIYMFDLLKSEPINRPFKYKLFVTTSINKIKNLHFIHNNMLGDIPIVSPDLNKVFIENSNVQSIGVVIHCKDGIIDNYSIINTLQSFRIIDQDKSEKIHLTGNSNEYFISEISPCENISNKFIVGRDIENRTKLFYSENLVHKIKTEKLDKYVLFTELNAN